MCTFFVNNESFYVSVTVNQVIKFFFPLPYLHKRVARYMSSATANENCMERGAYSVIYSQKSMNAFIVKNNRSFYFLFLRACTMLS
jgi:hypothetical protein